MSQTQNCHELALRMNRLLCAMLVVYGHSLENLKDEKMRTPKNHGEGGGCKKRIPKTAFEKS